MIAPLVCLLYLASAAAFSSHTVVYRAPTHATRVIQNSPPIVLMKGADGIKHGGSADGSNGKDEADFSPVATELDKACGKCPKGTFGDGGGKTSA